jgi:hypothetical protein
MYVQILSLLVEEVRKHRSTKSPSRKLGTSVRNRCAEQLRAWTKQRRRGRQKTAICSLPYTTCYNNNVALHVSSMDEPSIQLQLDLNRTVQHELASCRPLLHRLEGSSWVLQIPRPSSAVAHGARFYYNILVNPCFVKEIDPSGGWFSKSLPTSDHLQTTAALEELLRDLETLATDLRPESSRKSNVTVGGSIRKLDTLVDAVVVTSLSTSYEDSFRLIHPDVPVFATQEAAQQIDALQHFRTVGTINVFGYDGCNDWRSTTALAGLPEWVGLSILPKQDGDNDQTPTLMIAFNNYHNNSSARLAKLQALTGSRQKRLAPTLPIEDEDFAEAVLFTSQRRLSTGVIPASHADPTIYPLVVIYSPSTLKKDADTLRTSEGGLENPPELPATYRVTERSFVAEKGRGFLAWLIAKARFATQETKSRVVNCPPQYIEDDTPQGSQKAEMCVGGSKVLI